VFSPGQVWGAITLAGLVQAALVLIMVMAHGAGAFVPRPDPPVREMAIAVKPMVDLPLLKKGGKPRPNKLPDMWKPPVPVKRQEERSAPTPLAKKTAEALPEAKPVKREEKLPPPEAPVAKQVERPVLEVQREVEDEPNVREEGAADGVEEGTEKDPLKARAVDLYRLKLTNWFKQGFSPPVDEVDCETLKALRASVTAQIGADHAVTGYNMVPSGNPIFDARVRRAMDGRVGQTVPPPPPNYPDLLETVVHPTFQGKNEKCK
jgi:hypothetical protein